MNKSPEHENLIDRYLTGMADEVDVEHEYKMDIYVVCLREGKKLTSDLRRKQFSSR